MHHVVLYHIIYHAVNDVWQVSVRSREVLQMVGEVEEPSALWRRGGHVGRELKRLQRRVRSTLEDWLDYYCVAIGTTFEAFLKCVMCVTTSGCNAVHSMSYSSIQCKKNATLSQSDPVRLFKVLQLSKKVAVSPHLANSTLLNSSMRILFTVTRVTRCLCAFLSDLFLSFRDQVS